MAASGEKRKSLLMRVKEESEKAGSKLNIQKTKIVASSPIISWQIEGGKVEAVTDLIFLVSKITADGECSYEIKRHLLLGRKAITNLGSILKSRDITLLTKICIVKALGFPVVRYRCESWTIKNLRVCWTARQSNQSILKEIIPEYSLKGLMLKVKIQYFGHLMQRANSLGRDLVAGKDRRHKEKGMSEDEMVR